MTISDGLMVVAVLVAPFLAVWAQRQIELWREHRRSQLSLFKTLMATRGQVVSAAHVQALNMIDLEFTGRSEESVRAAWREYRDHLYSFPREGEELEAKRAVWQQRTQDLLAGLLHSMGKSLRYELDPVEIRKGAYSPEAHAVAELELQAIRGALIKWLSGGQSVSVSLVPADEKAAEQGEEFRRALLGLLGGETCVNVRISPHHDCQPSPSLASVACCRSPGR